MIELKSPTANAALLLVRVVAAAVPAGAHDGRGPAAAVAAPEGAAGGVGHSGGSTPLSSTHGPQLQEMC
jgi:hypothetical protein